MSRLKLLISGGIAVAVIFMLLFLRWHWITLGESRIQTRWDAQVQQQQLAAARHQAEQLRKVRTKESQLNKTSERINHDYSSRETEKDARIAGLRAELGRLQHALNTAPRDCGMPAPGNHASTGPTVDGAPASTGELFADCGQKYAAVAAEADRLANQVMGLQEYANMCQRQGE